MSVFIIIIINTYDGTSGAGRLPVGVGLGPILDGTVGAGLDGAPGADLCGFDEGPVLDPATDLGDGGLPYTQQRYTCHTILSKKSNTVCNTQIHLTSQMNAALNTNP